uniref:Zinc finger protein ZPR1 n=1 Tax=Syphacia muris TaxID=451379 RepID=A0A0N5APG2_9BILA
MVGTDSTDDKIFSELSSEDVEKPYEIESLCPRCEKNGVTKIMCVRIPYYRQVIIMSFYCEHCGCRNNELQSAEAVQEHGTEIVLHVKEIVDLNRQLVKSEFAQIEIPEIELTIPSQSQPGEVTTVEGVLQRTKAGLLQDQQHRREKDPENAEKIDDFLKRLEDLIHLRRVFTMAIYLKLKDPSGNCYIENPNPFHVDPRCITTHYCRTLVENKILGLADDNQTEVALAPEWKSFEDAKQEVLRFPTDCPNCGAHIETCMKPTDIPYFSTVIIMSTTCEYCGLRTNEVKSCGAIRDCGCRLVVYIEKAEDLVRDVLKSDTCSLSIPELDLEVGPGALASRFTTVEGLLTATKEQIQARFLLKESCFFFGDSASVEAKKNFTDLFARFQNILTLKEKVHLVLDDPAGNSYIQSLAAPLDDPRLAKQFYARSYEQNDELGLNDMKTENYTNLETVEEEENTS